MRMSTAPPRNSALVIRLRFDGTLAEVLHDDFGLTPRLLPGSGFAGIVAPASVRKAQRFLQAAAAGRTAVDYALDVLLPEGTAPLYFTATPTHTGIVIAGVDGPLHRAEPRAAAALQAAAHDLRNPASGILAASEFLLEDDKGGLEEYHLNLLRSIQSSSRLLLRRIDEMVDPKPAEAARLRMQWRPADLVKLVQDCAARNRPLAANRNVRLEVKANGAVPPLDIDPRRMSHAMNALLRHEIQRCAPGARIDVTIDAAGDEARIAVRGQSLAPLSDARERRRALALAGVRRIVEGNRGTISVESEARKSSSFTVRLPLPASVAPSAGSVSSRNHKRAVKRVATG